ncbi:neutral zinc metallopeptidase [Allokutzneria sp. A3M-2-11 16]|uniref:neutral zinc metallopeptidase n=1 Tax=Allokutzneria sp. A3M-2-11 16 TaxID=2962043 RepID=UPI0020B7B647|nr:neutral zinc metallopeptidase [Allokutzneria sp. A3M-2-11 16]MCP3798162.1 neutral zinc metallopeptidase [Allokutzneria sp. A3M-2-11 16]
MGLFGSRAIRRALCGLGAVCVLVACTNPVPGEPIARVGITKETVNPAFINGTDGGEIDQLAATVVTDVQQYWRENFEPTYGRPWQPINGFYSVDSNDQAGKPPPCTSHTSELEGNALYCASVDSVVWDRAALFPVINTKYSGAAVLLVLAHEIGHAVHHRAGIGAEELRKQPERYPTILTEAMADCFAGATLRWAVEGKAPHLRVTQSDVDTAMGVLMVLRDPVDTVDVDEATHGNAFDRASALQDGYAEGPRRCAGMTVQNRRFTVSESAVTRPARGYQQSVDAISAGLDRWFGALVRRNGGQWSKPGTGSGASCGGQGPASFCVAEHAIRLDGRGEPQRLHEQIGDYSIGALLAARYGLAAMAALGRGVDGAGAGRDALCLAGAYTDAASRGADGSATLAPGDLDEAVQVLLGYDYGSRDVAGAGIASGFDRIAAFRAGVLGGAKTCGIG